MDTERYVKCRTTNCNNLATHWIISSGLVLRQRCDTHTPPYPYTGIYEYGQVVYHSLQDALAALAMERL